MNNQRAPFLARMKALGLDPGMVARDDLFTCCGSLATRPASSTSAWNGRRGTLSKLMPMSFTGCWARPARACNGGDSQLARGMIAAGATDQAIADRIGGINRMAVNRHRHNHVVAPAKASAAAAGKGQHVAAQRAAVMAAAEVGDPAAFIAPSGIVNDLRRVHDRLERAADAAKLDVQRLTVASLSAQ